jgi:hypothetical protein
VCTLVVLWVWIPAVAVVAVARLVWFSLLPNTTTSSSSSAIRDTLQYGSRDARLRGEPLLALNYHALVACRRTVVVKYLDKATTKAKDVVVDFDSVAKTKKMQKSFFLFLLFFDNF